MSSESSIVLHATPFREIPGTRSRIGFGDALAAADDGLTQLAPLQKLIDTASGNSPLAIDQQLVGNAQAAMLALTVDLNAVRAAGPTDVFAAPSKFNGASFLAGLGLALVSSALLYFAIDNSSHTRRPARRRRTA